MAATATVDATVVPVAVAVASRLAPVTVDIFTEGFKRTGWLRRFVLAERGLCDSRTERIQAHRS